MKLTKEQSAEINQRLKVIKQKGCSIRVGKYSLRQSALDHGFVRVVDYMGDDTSIVQAASFYGKGTGSIN